MRPPADGLARLHAPLYRPKLRAQGLQLLPMRPKLLHAHARVRSGTRVRAVPGQPCRLRCVLCDRARELRGERLRDAPRHHRRHALLQHLRSPSPPCQGATVGRMEHVHHPLRRATVGVGLTHLVDVVAHERLLARLEHDVHLSAGRPQRPAQQGPQQGAQQGD
jgi:hypothetical protein